MLQRGAILRLVKQALRPQASSIINGTDMRQKSVENDLDSAGNSPTAISSEPCDNPNRYANFVSGAAVSSFLDKVMAFNSPLHFRLVAQGSSVKFLYKVDRENTSVNVWSDDKSECIPIGLKTIRCTQRPTCLRYDFRFSSPVNGGYGLVLIGTQPGAVFMLPSNSMMGQTHLYASPHTEDCEWFVENPGTEISETLIRWWDEGLVPRTTTDSWVASLFSDKETGTFINRRFFLLHIIAQIDEIFRRTCGWVVDYTDMIREEQRYRGSLFNKSIAFVLAAPVPLSGFEKATSIFRSTLKRDRDDDFLLIIPHHNSGFDRFFLFPRFFVNATAAKSDSRATGYRVYPSDRHSHKSRIGHLQSLQEKFEIKCDQESLRVVPGYEEKLNNILNGKIHWEVP